MDPSNNCASDGSGSDGNEDRLVNTSSRGGRPMPSSPTGPQLMSLFNAAVDAGSSGSSLSPSSSGAFDQEALPTPNRVRCLRLVPTNNTIIMEGELLDDDDNEPGTPSGTRRSTFIDNDGPINRVSIVSDLDLVLVGGSRRRRRISNVQVGSSSRQPEPEQRHCLPFYIPTNFLRDPPPPNMNFLEGPPPMSPLPPRNMNFSGGLPPSNMNYVEGPPPTPSWGMTPEGFFLPQNAYAPPAVSYYQQPLPEPLEVITRRSSGLYPPPGITIGFPLNREGYAPAPPPEPRVRSKVTIKPPPGSEGTSTSAPKQPEQSVPSRATTTSAPPASEGCSSSSARVPTFQWSPTAEEDAFFTEKLYGPSRRRRLPVFQDICPDDETSQPPPPPTSQHPPSPPPQTSQEPPRSPREP